MRMEPKMEHQYQTIIKPQNSLLDLQQVKETLKYKDLIFLFIKRDFVSKYKQTILGPAWAIIQPLLTTVVFTIVFGNLANLTTLDVNTKSEIIIPGFLFYMAGTICWSYFSSTVSSTSNTFIGNSGILGKVYFPRLVMPISTALSNLISFSIQFFMFLFFWAYFIIKGNTDIHISIFICFLPLLLIQLIMLSTGVGIIISSLTTKYRDLAMLVGFGLQLWQYGSPIAYGLSLIPERYMALYMSNPVTSIIVIFRYALFGTGYFHIGYYVLSWVMTIVIFFIGVILFNRIEKTFMDTV